MRTRFVFITLLLVANCALAQFVNLKFEDIEAVKNVATYSISYQPDSTNPFEIRNSTYLLFLGDNISKYLNRTNYVNDTTIRKFTTSKQVIEYLSDPKVPKGSSLQIFKNYPKGYLTFINYIPPSTYRYEENMQVFNWAISDDTSKAFGYKIQKATCDYGGRSWVAWFAPELPYSDGPYKFNGLPGLIVKLFDTRQHYFFELVSFSKPENLLMIDIEDEEYVKTTKNGFFQAEDNFREDIINRAKAIGADNIMQQMAAKNMASRNNPIELLRK